MNTLHRSKLRNKSAKQRKRDAEWKEITAERMEFANHRCEIKSPICWHGATGGHHVVKRRFHMQSFDLCRAACDPCNGYIEDHPLWAKENGFVLTPLEAREQGLLPADELAPDVGGMK